MSDGNLPFEQGTTPKGDSTATGVCQRDLIGRTFRANSNNMNSGGPGGSMTRTLKVVRQTTATALTMAGVRQRRGLRASTNAAYSYAPMNSVNGFIGAVGVAGYPLDDGFNSANTQSFVQNDLMYAVVEGPCKVPLDIVQSHNAGALTGTVPVNTKMAWGVSGGCKRAVTGELAFGTVMETYVSASTGQEVVVLVGGHLNRQIFND